MRLEIEDLQDIVSKDIYTMVTESVALEIVDLYAELLIGYDIYIFKGQQLHTY